MTTTTLATGTIESKSWDQTEFAVVPDAPTLGAAKGYDLYTGDIEGDAEWQGLTCTLPDGSGSFDSLQRTRCTLGGRSGSFILRMTGTFDPTGNSRADWSVVPGSGTEGLTGISGTGGYRADDGTNTYTLTYRFDR
ncbi:DUF3224 domain-containing protein [Nocardia altamirensis]|uniref:DUF3224 domain-containing protein n=1 Tax=Nocardia altamirensis TaxID=472158 RepID=UPI00084026DE|nr:DUF3224 domain-containing protein [Nocardia altamirensis]